MGTQYTVLHEDFPHPENPCLILTQCYENMCFPTSPGQWNTLNLPEMERPCGLDILTGEYVSGLISHEMCTQIELWVSAI